MIGAAFAYLLVLSVGAVLYQKKRWVELSIIAVPILFCGYFLLSIGVFSFGEAMPFRYYSPDRKAEYGYVLILFSLHFVTVICGFAVVNRFDRRSYVDLDRISLKSFYVGSTGAIFCLLPAFIVVSALPTSDLWRRNTFSYDTDPLNLLRFADLLVLISAVLIPFIKSTPLKYLTLAMVTLSFLALGSRTAILLLFVFAAMNLFIVRKSNKWVSLVVTVVAFWLLGTLLLLRDFNSGGLALVLETAIFGDAGAIAEAMLYGSNYNFNLSFVLIAELLASVQTEDRWFIYGILPLPSAFFDQTEQYDSFNRFRKNVPYSGVGYLWAYLGPTVYFVIVFLSTLAILTARKIVSETRDVFELILCSAMFLFPFIIMLQYNLRTGTRVAYALIFVYFVVALLRKTSSGSQGQRIQGIQT